MMGVFVWMDFWVLMNGWVRVLARRSRMRRMRRRQNCLRRGKVEGAVREIVAFFHDPVLIL